MTQLQSIIATLNSAEKSEFLKYVRLYKNQGSLTSEVAEWILKLVVQDISLVSTVELFRAFGEFRKGTNEKNPSFQVFKNQLSLLGNLSRDFIGWKSWNNNHDIKNTTILLGLAERGLNDQFLKFKKSILDNKENLSINLWSEYFYAIALFYEYNFQISENKDNYEELFTELIKTFKTGVAKVSQSLLIEVKNRSRIIKNEDWSHELEFFDLLYENNTNFKNVSDLLVRMIDEEDLEAYQELMSLIENEEISDYSHFLQYSILVYCTVYLNRIFKKGDHSRVNEILKLQEIGLSRGILSPTKEMGVMTFINVITVIGKLGSPEEARKAISQYIDSVRHTNKKVVKQLAEAHIDFYATDYSRVLKRMRTIQVKGFDLKFKARWLELKAQFELRGNELVTILDQLNNYRRYINANDKKINQSTYKGMIQSLKILRMMCLEKSQEEIEMAIRSSKYLFEKRWIVNYYKRNLKLFK